MRRPMYICTGFTTSICPAFYAVILLINILLSLLESDELGCGGRQRVAVVSHSVHPVVEQTERRAPDTDVTDT